MELPEKDRFFFCLKIGAVCASWIAVVFAVIGGIGEGFKEGVTAGIMHGLFAAVMTFIAYTVFITLVLIVITSLPQHYGDD